MEDFLEMHPEHTDDDEKTQMFARINHELSERELLEQERQGLLKKKQGLIADNKKRKDDLANLDKDLETFIDVGGLHFPHILHEYTTLTHLRLPNLYKRPSKSITEHLPTPICLPWAGVSTEWRTIGTVFEIPISRWHIVACGYNLALNENFQKNLSTYKSALLNSLQRHREPTKYIRTTSGTQAMNILKFFPSASYKFS